MQKKTKTSFADSNPILASEWHPTKNGSLKPGDVTPGSSKRVWWKCPVAEDHEWQTSVGNRATQNTKCPFCLGSRVSKNNNLQENFPDVATEWHPSKNNGLTPSDFTKGSNKKVWWQCLKGHSWQATIANRIGRKSGCPKCSKRSSAPEIRMLCEIRTIFKSVEWQFRIEGLEFDIYINDINCLLEYDGSYYHRGKKSRDLKKSDYASQNSFNFLRVRQTPLPRLSASDIILTHEPLTKIDIDQILSALSVFSDLETKEKIAQYVEKNSFQREKEYKKYLSYFPGPIPEKSFAGLYPNLANEWHQEKNNPLTPELFSPGSRHKVWWKCSEGHEWEAVIQNRTSQNQGCPYCSGQRVSDKNRLSVLYPTLVHEFHPTLNQKLDIKELSYGSNSKVWWKCSEGHEWEASVLSRTTQNQGCPYCSGQRVSDKNRLDRLYPEIAAEFHPTKNNEIKLEELSYGTIKKIWWKCAKDHSHEWQTSPSSRTNTQAGCPYCSGRRVHKSNCLATKAPEVAMEWHPTKNGDLTPNDLTSRSSQKVWWKCPNGADHEWVTSVNNRTGNNTGCPFCVNQKVSKHANLLTDCPKIAKEWHPTKNGNKFPSDYSVGSSAIIVWTCGYGHEWEAKIYSRTLGAQGCPYCGNFRLHKENSLSSKSPELAKEWHPSKNNNLKPQGVRYNSAIKVWWQCSKNKDHNWRAKINARTTGRKTGCPHCSGTRVHKSNSLETNFPNLALQWHPTKNGALEPSEVTVSSGKKVWWRCENNESHEWEAQVKKRTVNGHKCPFCVGKKVSKETSLATLYPHIAEEWHSVKNGNLTPNDVTVGSSKKVWWMCVNGHEWQAVINKRTKRGDGCRKCRN